MKTMDKITSRSVGARMGYSDDDLTTPGHDALVLWVVSHCVALAAEFLPEAALTVYRPEIEKRAEGGGWIDVLITAQSQEQRGHQSYARRFELAVEVKTTIRSLGELIRQLRCYGLPAVRDSYQTKRSILVVSPDDRFTEAIEHQGFLFKKVEVPAEEA